MNVLLRLAIGALSATTVSATTHVQISASEALATAERLCDLPKGAEFVGWSVVSSDEVGAPPPQASLGRYWVVRVRYTLPHRDQVVEGLLGVPKGGGTPTGCAKVPAPEISMPHRRAR